MSLGRPFEAIAVAYGAVSFAQRIGVFHSEGRARMTLSSRLAGDDPREAFEVCRTGIERAVAVGQTNWVFGLYANGASMALQLGEWDWVEEAGRELDLDIVETNIGSLWAAVPRISLRMYRGDIAGAAVDIERLRVAVGERPDPQTVSLLLSLETELQMLQGNTRAAIETATRGLSVTITEQIAERALAGGRAAVWARDAAVVRDMGPAARAPHAGRFDEARAEALEAAADALSGDRPSARERFDRAVGTMRDVGVSFEVALVQLDRVIVMPDDPAAEDAAAEARAIFERLGARPFLERLDAALGAGSDLPEGEPSVAPKPSVVVEPSATQRGSSTSQIPR
jgi:hypothetical protein